MEEFGIRSKNKKKIRRVIQGGNRKELECFDKLARLSMGRSDSKGTPSFIFRSETIKYEHQFKDGK